jgi:hypothetical protein
MPDLSIARLARASWVHVAFAFLAMGAWAVFANRGHPPGEAITAGLVQGTISGLITLVLKRFLETLSGRLSPPLAYLLPPLISCAVILALLFCVHTLAGTPEVWATLAVPFAVSSTYAWVYTAIVVRGRSHGDAA